MTRAVVCVATTAHYQKGLLRLDEAVLLRHGVGGLMIPWGAPPWPGTEGKAGQWPIPGRWPTHADKPYAFKAYALFEAAKNANLLLWCDASILPIRSLEPLWQRIESEGYWIARNGWNNHQWTADSAYPYLFPGKVLDMGWGEGVDHLLLDAARVQNAHIPHVVATSFGLNVKHPIGKAFLDEYFRLASETKAFCGPWINRNNQAHLDHGTRSSCVEPRCAPCGPPDVLGHRHDQTAASVIAWRLGMKLTDCPEIFAYSKRRADGTLHLSDQDERTILLADGKMEDGTVHV